MNRNTKRKLTALVLALVMLAGFLAGCAPAGGNAANSGNTEIKVPEGYCLVEFALPKDATDQDKEYTTLPEPVVVEKGTFVGTLPDADRISCIFLGWNYDETDGSIAQEDDHIDENLVLYPRFALKEGMQDGGYLNYVSKRDVPSSFAMEIIAYKLTEDEIREILMLSNASTGEEGLPFVLEDVHAEEIADFLGSLGLKGDTLTAAVECVRNKEADPSISLSDSLALLGTEPALELATIDQIVDKYAPAEHGNGIDMTNLDAESKAIISAMGTDLLYSTEAELKEAFRLDEDDSLERFWREDLGLRVEDVLRLEEIILNNEPRGNVYRLRPQSGSWEGGDVYSASISDTSKLRFVYDGEETDANVVEYNITVHQQQVINTRVSSQVNYVPADQVQGVEFLGMLDLQTDENGDIIAMENYRSGIMTYSGSMSIAVGDVLAVHKGEIKERGFTDDDVTYIKITNVLGSGRYEYEHAGLEDVLFLADNIPVPDDGSLSDGNITVPSAELDFSDPVFIDYGLTASSVVEPGDYITFYTGSLGGGDYKVTGHGLIKTASLSGGSWVISYDLTSEEELLADELLLYMDMPEAEFELAETEEQDLQKQMEEQILSSGIVEETGDFLTGLVLGEDIDFDSLEHGEELRNMSISLNDEDITLEGLRQLADGAERVEISDVHVTFLCGINLQHFEGKKGVRAEVAVSFTIEIAIADAGKLEIQPAIVLEQEFLLTPHVKVVRHKNPAGLTSSLDITASLEAGTYSGFGVCVTAKTKNNPNPNASKDWEEMVGNFMDNGDDDSREARTKAAKVLIKLGNKLIDNANKQKSKGQGTGADYNFNNNTTNTGNSAKQDYVSPGIGGDLPTKYSSMLSNDAKYIDLVSVDLASADFPIDPMGIIHCGIKDKFVVSLKINAMIGSGISYENAKMYSYRFRAKIWGGGEEMGSGYIGGSSVTDVATPNFRVDFYAFGMVGLRIGMSLDLRVGVFSTDLDSVGVVATAGIYAELYGFLYCWYEWTSGQGSTSGAMGSLLFEAGIYADISVKVQVGMGKASKSWSLYSLKTPLVQLGCVKYPIDFTIKPNDAKLDVDIPDGENTVKVPDELYY
ncbi:MAG: hypothetical protein II485_07045, partial [Firmicutes bacterium]|nr:hypothetical protein [Bacillota bacterium]